MIITAELLRKRWRSINFFDGGYLRLEVAHQLEWYIGFHSIEQMTIMLVLNNQIYAPQSSKSIIVSARQREIDGRWTLIFELMKNEQEEVFINLCCDLISYSSKATNEKDALSLVISRYKQWNRLLEYQNKGLLDEASRKGLLGELIFLKSKILEGVSPFSVVQSWVGSEGADQDFSFADRWYEVKTIGVSADTVNISSIQQLDRTDRGFLIIIRVDKCAPERQGAFTLVQKIEEVRQLLNNDYDSIELFENKLVKRGYIDIPEYSEQYYYYSDFKSYIVNENFPKLISRNVPLQVIACQYTLSINGIASWEV